jgi:signal transduction histidine kinase/HAMP domain-containing protein
MNTRLRFRGFSSFRARVFWSVVPIVVSFLVFQAWMNIREHRRLVTEEFEKRGQALAANLGFASELGALSEDAELLMVAMRGTLRNPDVAYVIIHAGDGRVLANGGRPATTAAPPQQATTDRALSRRVESAGQRFIEFASPIVSEQTQTPDELLIGARVRPGGGAAKEQVIGGVRLGLSLAGVEEQVRALATLWGGITVAFLGISALAIYGFSRRITKPVKQLTEQAQKIAAGNLEEPIAVKSRDEIGQLATAFNSMTGSLQVTMRDKEHALGELQELNRTLEDRIRRRTVELEERSVALERSLAEVRAMGDVSRAIGSSLDLAEVLSTISTHALRLTGTDACGIFQLDLARERLVVVASLGLDRSVLEMLERTPIIAGERANPGPIARALTSGQTVQVPDIAAATLSSRDGYLQAGLRALVAVPMGSVSVSHVMVVYRREPGRLDDRTVEMLTTLANQSRVAIDNARLFKELADKSRQLEAASRHKSDFLANVSHELRTPMNAILGFNELILDEGYGEIPQDLRRPLTDIQQSGKHLLRLINDVLDLSKIEAGHMQLAPGEYSVRDAVEAVRTALGSLAMEKGLDFVTAVPPGLPLAYGDSKRIIQCLTNLAGNALKFTKRGRVEIAVERLDDTLRFRVSDTGIGIAQEHIAGLFAEFQQADSTIAREFGGTGLGLSITKRFVEMHGGRVGVESEVGIGSTFYFSIPLRLEAGRAA